ncbi:hypothetical protein [Candidatus Spongiihabitans sp.]
MKNKHVIRCRISENKFRVIPRLFCLDINESGYAGRHIPLDCPEQAGQ